MNKTQKHYAASGVMRRLSSRVMRCIKAGKFPLNPIGDSEVVDRFTTYILAEDEEHAWKILQAKVYRRWGRGPYPDDVRIGYGLDK